MQTLLHCFKAEATLWVCDVRANRETFVGRFKLIYRKDASVKGEKDTATESKEGQRKKRKERQGCRKWQTKIKGAREGIQIIMFKFS